jgi:hypothetical protein
LYVICKQGPNSAPSVVQAILEEQEAASSKVIVIENPVDRFV